MMNRAKKHNTRRMSILKEPPLIVHNKFEPESDIIANSIINKIISLAISNSIRNNIEKEIPNKCFTYIKEFLKNKLLIEFLPHDEDDIQNSKIPNELSMHSNKFFSNNSSFQEKEYDIMNNSNGQIDNNYSLFNIEQIFYNNNLKGENDWNILDEPISNKYDSYSTTMVKFIEIEKQEIPAIKHKNKKGMKINELEEVKEEESISKSHLNKENENINDNNINTNNVSKEDKKSELTKKSQKKSNKRIKIFVPTNQVKKKRNDVDIHQFPCEDIPTDDINYESNNEINYEKLRKELKELEEAKLKEESNKNKKRNKSIDIKQIIGDNSNNKKFFGKNITVDPNGEIVLIRALRLDKLKQEFKYPKTILKNIKQPKKIIKKEEKKEINIEQKVEDNKENLAKNENDNNEINKQKDINNIPDQLNADSNLFNDKKILPKLSQNKLNLQIKKENKELKKIKREPVFPSGSNFDLINLEIGVSIKEDEKYKTGGKDFFKKFNKYSKDIYNEKLKESIAANSFFNTKSQLLTETNNFKTESNFENTYGTFNMTSNQIENSIQKDSKYLMTSTNNFGNYNYISNFSNIIGNNNNNLMTKTSTAGINKSNILNPSIRLSNISSLVGTMDKLNLISEREERFAKKNRNLFKNLKKHKVRGLLLNQFDEIDKFTKDILKTGDWSNRKFNKSQGMRIQGKTPEKPSILELRRELGNKNNSIRNRRKVVIPSINNPSMRTVEFFK